MNLLLWVFLYLIGLVIELAVAPLFFGGAAPPLSALIFFTAAAFQGFWPGFVFAGLAGFIHDALFPAAAARYVVSFVGIFFLMRAFGTLTQWDEPWRRIGVFGSGLLLFPFVWALASYAARWVFAAPFEVPGWSDFASAFFARESAYALVWFAGFAWLAIRGASGERARRLQHL